MHKNFRTILLLNLFLILMLTSCRLSNPEDNPYNPEEEAVSDYEIVQDDKYKLDIIFNGSDHPSSVTQNLTLTATGSSGSTVIHWTSNNSAIITSAGEVRRPDYYDGDAAITLTATISKNAEQEKKYFTVTVIRADLTDFQRVAADKEALIIGYSGGDSALSVTQNLTLPASGANGSVITWDSSDTDTITGGGIVTRPGYYDGDRSVTLTATISKNDVSDTKIFTVTVIKAPMTDAERVAADKEALVITFQGDGSILFAASNISLTGLGINGSIITWSSGNTNIISIAASSYTTGPDGLVYVDTYSGQITFPATGGLYPVLITATIVKNNAQEIKTFTIYVPSLEYIEANSGVYN